MGVTITVECDRCGDDASETYDTWDGAVDSDRATVHPFDGWWLDEDGNEEGEFVLCPMCLEDDTPAPPPPLSGHPNRARALPAVTKAAYGWSLAPPNGVTPFTGEACPACGIVHCHTVHRRTDE